MVRTIQDGKLEERRYEVQDHGHRQAGVSKGKKEKKLDDKMLYCMAVAEPERRCLGASERWDGGGEASAHSVTSSHHSVFCGVIKRWW